jgi:hypothetical protein
VSAARLPPFPRVARGQRPDFFADESSDILLSMNVALLSELMATRERLDTLERLLARKGVVANDEIEGFEETPQDEAEREQRRETMARHVFYLLLQQAERAARSAPAAEPAPTPRTPG